jgi:hypothetical protein
VNWLAAQPFPNGDPNTYFWNNTVWTTVRDHRDRAITVFGDGHAQGAAAGRIFIPETADWWTYDQVFWGSDRDPSL